MSNRSRRGSDSRGEKAVALFLDKYFYPKLIDEEIINDCERVYDKNRQFVGIDVLIYVGDKQFKIDEKAQLYYMNNPIETFSFEVDFISPKTDVLTSGWLISDKNETEIFNLIWIHDSRETKVSRIVADDFIQLESYLISKNNILNYLQSIGYSKEVIVKYSKEIRDNKVRKKKINDECYFVLSDSKKYVEAPINIVIRKSKLNELCKQKYVITKEHIKSV